MFSNDELKQLGDLLDERLEQKLEEKLEQKLEEKLEQKLEEKLEQKFEVKLKPIYSELKNHGKTLKSIRKTVDLTARVLDKEQMEQRKRIAKIESHLN